MSDTLNRRDFLIAGAAAGLAAAAPRTLLAETAQPAQAPAVIAPKGGGVKPVVISSANGNKFKNGGDATCVQRAFVLITQGLDVLDALIAGVNIVELDPTDDSVGYGGLPNAEGVVQLDSCCMHGPRRQGRQGGGDRGGAHPVAGRQGGDGADRSPPDRRQGGAGVRPQPGVQDRGRPQHRALPQPLARLEAADGSQPLPRPAEASAAGFAAAMQMAREGLIDREKLWGTINCDGVNAKGEVCGVTTTSGLAWKIPGRVGDSPILGAGLWVDGEVGAAGSTGRGEANLYNLLALHLIVEAMRRGAPPTRTPAWKRSSGVVANTRPRKAAPQRARAAELRSQVLRPQPQGEHAGVSLYPGQYALCNDNGPATLDTEAMFDGHA